MTNVERFWEASVAEAVSNRHPPDQAAEILARLTAPAEPAPRKRVARWIRYPVELAAAAALIVAIGLATGLIKWPEETVEKPDPGRTWVAGPGAEVKETETGLLLESGYLLLKTGALDVRRDESLFTNLEGIAVVRAGDAPSDDDHAAIQQWLHERKVDEAMIAKATRWAAGAAMCVLMLQGSAQLDGQEVKAEEKPASAPVWHDVRSVMDIDNLPDGATHVRADGQSCALLDFLVEVPSLEAISIQGGKDLRAEHVSGLSKLIDLKFLDLRGTEWAETPNYKPVLGLAKLAVVGLDPEPEYWVPVQNARQRRTVRLQEVVTDLTAIENRGLHLLLGAMEPSDDDLTELFRAVPRVRSLTLKRVSDHQLKMVAGLKELTGLRLWGPKANEIGFAYLARGAKLTELHVGLYSDQEFTQPILHHIGRISTLTDLRLDGEIVGDARESLRLLADLKNLRHLELSYTNADAGEGEYWRPALDVLPAVHSLRIGLEAIEDYDIKLWEIPTARASRIHVDFEYLGGVAIDEYNGESQNSVTEALTFNFVEVDGVLEAEQAAGLAGILKRCTKLKRIEVSTPERAEVSRVRALVEWVKAAAGMIEVVHIR